MPVNYIVLAIPVFFLLIGVELLAVRLTHKADHYRLSDSINDLSCGIVQQMLEVFLKTALFAGYLYIHQNHRLAEIPGTTAAWVACFLGVDFLYYWFHRMSHEVGAFWAAHVVHHQSEEFNLAVALRQGALQGSFSWAFYLPLALLGFPPLMFLTLSSFNTLYQFWIHTRLIGRLGPLEWVLNTPSNHRVHHGRDPKYIDRNHGGTLIVWDRLFGTYQKEEEEPVYGITKPLATWNPVWANLQYWTEIADKVRGAGRAADKLRALVKPPGWQPPERGGFQPAPEVDRRDYRKWDVAIPGGLAAYAFVQFLPVLAGTALLLFRQSALSGAQLAMGALVAVGSLIVLGGLLERKPWAFYAEALRLPAAAALAGLAFTAAAPSLAAAVLALAVGSLCWLYRYRRLFVAPAGIRRTRLSASAPGPPG